ncbi:MAG: hypothetical protein WC002_10730 [Candidatus Muiribacteriota bacterium]
MKDENSELYLELGNELIEKYQTTIFGKISKAEIDIIVFNYLVKIIIGAETPLFKINKEQIRRISLTLGITESRVSTMIENVFLYETKVKGEEGELKAKILEEIFELAGQTIQDKKDLEEGKIRIYIPNKIFKNAIQHYFIQIGGLIDTTFNRNIMVIRLVDLLKVRMDSKEISEEHLKKIIKNIKSQQNFDEKQKQFLKELNEKPASEIGVEIIKDLATIYLGEKTIDLSEKTMKWLKKIF